MATAWHAKPFELYITDSPNKHTMDTRTEEEMIEGVRAKMLDAVRVRLQADVPVGIHLSGGVDSAVIAGMAKHLLDKGEVKLGSDGDHHLRCLGIAFDKGSGYDESGESTQAFLLFGGAAVWRHNSTSRKKSFSRLKYKIHIR